MVIKSESIIFHCKQIINNKLYDISKASVVYQGDRWYFITEKGNYFSAKKSSICNEYTILYTLSDIKLETEESTKDILAKYDIGTYQILFGEVEEA